MTATAAMTAMTLSFSARVVVLVAHCRCSWTSAGMFYFHLPSGNETWQLESTINAVFHGKIKHK
jgi:hypothetical protein